MTMRKCLAEFLVLWLRFHFWWPALLVWQGRLDSSVGRTSERYSEGPGIELRYSCAFFLALWHLLPVGMVGHVFISVVSQPSFTFIGFFVYLLLTFPSTLSPLFRVKLLSLSFDHKLRQLNRSRIVTLPGWRTQYLMVIVTWIKVYLHFYPLSNE